MRCKRCGREITRYSTTQLCATCVREDNEVRRRRREALYAYYERTTYASLGRGERMSPKERERLLRNVGRLNPILLPGLLAAMDEWEKRNRRYHAGVDPD